MKSFPETLIPQKRRPLWWSLSIALLMLADIAAPSNWGLCVLHLLMLPLAWRFLHRRVITRITIAQGTAVAFAGLWHAMYGPIFDGTLLGEAFFGVAPGSATTGVNQLYFDPVRLWTLLALIASGYFHVYLRSRLRLRLKHQQYLQQGVRRRSQEVARVNHALRDEVARRQATQHRLDQSETTFQSIMDRMHLQVARKNAEGVFTYANDPFCKELGLKPIDVIGSTDADLYAPVLAARYRADDLNVMTTGLHVDKVEEHPGIDGRTGFVQVFKAPEYDQHGRCIGIQAIFWDVTEKHRGAMELQNSEARKRALFDAAGDAVLLVDDRGVIMEANPAAMNLLQAGGGRLVGRPLEDLIMPVATTEQPQSTRRVFQRQTMTWETLPFTERHQLRLRRGDGVAFDSEVSIHPIPLGDRDGRAVIIRDITLQQQAFEAMREAKAVAEQANRTKTQFMAGISHELRTPLGGIRGLTELLAAQTLPAAARRYVNLIAQNTELLHDAIEDILDFSAIEAGRVAIDPTPIDLHEVVGDAFGCLAIRVADKPVRLCLSIDPKMPRRVVADPKRIRQIIVNLAGNAIKFTPQGLVSLRLSLADGDASNVRQSERRKTGNDFLSLLNRSEKGERSDENTREFEMTIVDTGIGIAPENQARIFDAFEQADRGTNKQFGGTGLGLAIARGLAERMGGGIELNSELGTGSCFRVRLKLKLADEIVPSKRWIPMRIGTALEPLSRPNNEDSQPRGAVVVSVNNETIEKAIGETLAHDGWQTYRPSDISSPTSQPSKQGTTAEHATQPIAWILTNHTADAAWRVRARKTNDRVLWLTRTGESVPRRAKKEDTIIIEPLHPDELRRWLAGKPLRQTARVSAVGSITPNRIATKTSETLTTTALSTVTSSSAEPRDNGRDRFHLLVVDDSPTNRLVIHDQLVSAGHVVTTADGGPTAIGHFRRGSFDCVLMDLQMPGMDGTEVTAEFVQIAKQLGRPVPPIIALTAHVTDQHRKMCRDAGMIGYITKPIHLEPLLVEIQRVVHSHTRRPVASTEPPKPKPVVTQPLTTDASTPAASPAPTTPPTPSTSPANPETPVSSEPDDEWRNRLSKHCGGDTSTIESVCEAITMEVPDLVRRLDRAASNGDAKSFKTAAHTLKSCLRYIAAPAHNDLAASLEKQCDDTEWFDRLHCATTSKSDGPEIQELRQVQTIAKSWVTRVKESRKDANATPAPPSSPRLF
ncbi:hybrid sensor histidine kinase/response regulator [Aporhodopirellula aestuarii]|uniref:histidine kinase n=1 Tax=Aporhodopirellula aestuarii TaxID=2950107 RepID=A0ABT0U8E2_9BACT|nr:PAS domain-containing protein [Aporhodopirellula aestuarii]MCM2373184.1 PAS domain-containing protein [Aporhodopirellula aestuarii]